MGRVKENMNIICKRTALWFYLLYLYLERTQLGRACTMVTLLHWVYQWLCRERAEEGLEES